MVKRVPQVESSSANRPDAPPPEGQASDPGDTAYAKGLPQPQTLRLMHEDGRGLLAEVVAYRGRLPPPSILREYEKVAPGTAAGILQLLEGQQQKRHENDKEQQKQNFILQRLALVLGFTLSMAGLGVALVVAMAGHPWVAGIVSAAVSTFSTHLVRNVLLPRKKTDLNRE